MTRISIIPPKPSPSERLKARGVEFIPTAPSERADALESTPWSNRLSWRDEQGIGEYLRSYRLEPGTVLFREGDRDAFVAIVVSGALDISKEDSESQSHVVARLGRGKMVGQMSLIDGAARSATAVAATATELLVMTKDEFDRMCQAQPELALKYALMIAEAIAQLLRQTTGRMVDHLED
ncbi:MAG: Crp/Fnr family transcriptional regulator [Gemmatimonadaceae bacterium]